MGSVNKGNQKLTFDYKHPTQGKTFNTLLRNLIKPGVYEGGEVTVSTGNTVSIAPLVVFVNVSTDKAIRVETQTAVSQTVTKDSPMIYIRYVWEDIIENWADFGTRATNDAPVDNEVLLGRGLFSGSTLIGISMDISDRTLGFFDENYDGNLNNLKVYSSPTLDEVPTTGQLRQVGNIGFNDQRYINRDNFENTILVHELNSSGNPLQAYDAVEDKHFDLGYQLVFTDDGNIVTALFSDS